MKRYALEERVVLLTLDTGRRIFAVFGRNVPRHARSARSLLLSAFQNNLDSIAFLSHRYDLFSQQERKGKKFSPFPKSIILKCDDL